ncbi:MAG: ATP-binding protein [Verrucomicrobia bacterium]|nr:ATP-binding protein [Verrucomicrobiota bacterium]
MADQRIFVGRKAELKRFDEILRDPAGQAILVVGQQGMGKTWLVEEMARRAIERGPALGLKCGCVKYHVAQTDSVDSTMELMIEDAYAAALKNPRPWDAANPNIPQWKALFSALGLLSPRLEKLGELALSLRRQESRETRQQFIERLTLISKRMKDDQRALFIVDSDKYMPDNSDQAWRIVVEQLPDKVKLVFAQRPDDALASSRDFLALPNILRVPREDLHVLDEEAVENLIDIYARNPGMPAVDELRHAVARYNGHPYAVPAALNLIADGVAIEELPADPTKEKIAEAQWQRIRDRKKDAIPLFEAYAILEVPVPDEVVEAVSGIEATSRKHVLADPYIGTLLKAEGDSRQIYHSILADHVRDQIGEKNAEPYHRRAIDEYRRRLRADGKPDALAATRLAEHVHVVHGDKGLIDCVISESGRVLANLGLLEPAVSLFERALSVVQEGSSEGATLLGNLGVIRRMRGELDLAEAAHKMALHFFERSKNAEGIASQCGNLGLVYRARMDLDEAEHIHRRALEIAGQLGHLAGLADQYNNLAAVYVMRGQPDHAVAMLENALEINEPLGRLEGMASQYGNLGLICLTRGDLDRAEKMLARSLEIQEQLGRPEAIAKGSVALGLILWQRGNVSGARKLWTKARDISGQIGMPHIVEKVEGLLDDLPDADQEGDAPPDEGGEPSE